MAARLALWEPQDDDGGHRRSVYMGAPRPLWAPLVFHPAMDHVSSSPLWFPFYLPPPFSPPSRGGSGGHELPPTPPAMAGFRGWGGARLAREGALHDNNRRQARNRASKGAVFF